MHQASISDGSLVIICANISILFDAFSSLQCFERIRFGFDKAAGFMFDSVSSEFEGDGTLQSVRITSPSEFCSVELDPIESSSISQFVIVLLC